VPLLTPKPIMALEMFIKEYLHIEESAGKGRGVFTKKDIPAGTVIECSPVLVLSPKDTKALEPTFLYNYYFIWGDTGRQTAIVLGYGSLYNHSYNASCRYETDYEDKTFKVITRKKINKGEELTINYNFYPDDQTPVWFDKKKLKEAEVTKKAAKTK
jgi:hypothetical protein